MRNWQTELLTPEQVSEILGVSMQSLRTWRVLGKGPRYVKISSRSIKYLAKDIDDFINSRLRQSTSEG